MHAFGSFGEAADACQPPASRVERRVRASAIRGSPIAVRLMMLIGATTIPFTVLSASILYGDYRTDRATAERQLVRQAQTVARLVDREVERAQAMARTIAASSALARSDIASFRQELVETTRIFGDDLPRSAQPIMIGLAGLEGNWIVRFDPQTGASRADGPSTPDVLQTIATGRAQVSNLHTVTGLPRVSVSVPVFSPAADGEARRIVGAIGVVVSRERFLEIVEETQLPRGALASIQDRQGITIARSVRDAETVGRPPAPAVLQTIMQSDSGMAKPGTKTLEGVPSAIAFAHAPKSGFIVKLDIPENIFLAPFRASMVGPACVCLLVLAFGLAFTALIARQLVIALRRVVPAAQEAAQLGATPTQLGLREADDMAGELTRLLIEQRTGASALAASEARLRTLADALPQLVWAARPDGTCDYFNARSYEFAGADELKAENPARLIHRNDRPALSASWKRALATGEPFELECRARRHDGEYRWMLVRAIPVRNEETGPVIRWFGSSTDITDLVEGRQVAARGRAELELLIDQRTRDLVDMQTRLAHAARMEALGQLAGGIAHDFNNVLQAVLGGSAIIERRPTDTALVAKHARLVLNSAERGAAITRRLLAFSHRSELRTETIDTGDLLRDIQIILSHTLGAAIKVEIAASAGLEPLLADKSQLETVLVNLATNARDAMGGSGSIILGATRAVVTDAKRDHPVALPPGAYICLSVSDTGTGMDAATLERVVEPFFTTKQAGQGTGLGLAMAHGFAGQSGGGLHIESVLGEGTTVKLWLPIAAAPPAEKRAAASFYNASSTAQPALLLLVDDEAVVRHVLKETLEMEGYQVVVAASAEQALAIMQAAPIDLLISDLSMPGMDGVTLIREAQRRRPGLPAVLMTGFARDETDIAMSGALSRSFSVLRKPVPPAQLCRRITDLLEAVPAPG